MKTSEGKHGNSCLGIMIMNRRMKKELNRKRPRRKSIASFCSR